MHEVLKVWFSLLYVYNINIYFMQEPASAKQTFSSSKEPSAFWTIPVLEYLRKSWGNMVNLPRFSKMQEAIKKGSDNLEKWYNKVNDTDAYFICLGAYLTLFWCEIFFCCWLFYWSVLDPNVKNEYALDKWSTDSYAAGMAWLEFVVSV